MKAHPALFGGGGVRGGGRGEFIVKAHPALFGESGEEVSQKKEALLP